METRVLVVGLSARAAAVGGACLVGSGGECHVGRSVAGTPLLGEECSGAFLGSGGDEG